MMMNNNTLLEICVNSINYDKSLYISRIIWYVCGFIGVIVGIPGHIFQIIILSNKTNRKEMHSLYFIAIAICELIFLLSVFWLWCANMSFVKTDPREVLSCGSFYSIIVGSTTLSNLYLASLSIDGIIMILYPTHYRLLVTRSSVILRIILICLIIILLLIPHHFYFYYNQKDTLFLCNFYSFVDRRKIRLWSLVHAILFVSIPSLIVCIFSLVLLLNRYKHKQIYKQNLSTNARRMHRSSIFIFFVSCGTFLCLLPTCILEIYIVHDQFLNRDQYCSIRWKIYKILLNSFLTISSIIYSMKFYINLVVSTPFRKSFIQLISCKYNQNPSKLTRVSNETNRRLLPSLNQNKTKFIET